MKLVVSHLAVWSGARPWVLGLLFALAVPVASAMDYRELIQQLDLVAILPTITPARTTELLGAQRSALPEQQQSAAALLVAIGAISASDLRRPEVAWAQAQTYVRVVTSAPTTFLGRIADSATLADMRQPPDYTSLLAADSVLQVLGQLVAKGTLTGYDLRERGVFDATPGPYWFVYSHSSRRHLQQLLALLASEQVGGWVYGTAKISAYQFRDDWGRAGPDVAVLAGGVQIVQGRETALKLVFDSAREQAHFRQLVDRYAKKDTADEPGLIADAWWQPFYYTANRADGGGCNVADTIGAGPSVALPDLHQIAMVVLSDDQFEATLTLLPAKVPGVLSALQGSDWTLRVDSVCVNPAYFRFLHGDHK
ncbi:MAG: hypothetical protein AAF993_02595 [Pseudomonadota bacterium]